MEKFDTEVGVSFSSSKRTSRSCICLVILSGAVVLLVTISAIFVTLYVMEKRSPAALSAATTSIENASLSTDHRTTVTPPTTEKPSATTVTYLPTTQKAREQKYCGSKTCLLASLGKLIFPPRLVKVYTVRCLIYFGNICNNVTVPCEQSLRSISLEK